jgi:predicted 2-oxoglutarate/Fe(II)-dependent dioxygenase YbiX
VLSPHDGHYHGLEQQILSVRHFWCYRGIPVHQVHRPRWQVRQTHRLSPGTLIRKLSFTVQLSEPEDYKGGDLCLYLGDKAEVMKKEQGFVALFPSYVLHEVKPVTSGTRYSLVSWITGKPFK